MVMSRMQQYHSCCYKTDSAAVIRTKKIARELLTFTHTYTSGLSVTFMKTKRTRALENNATIKPTRELVFEITLNFDVVRGEEDLNPKIIELNATVNYDHVKVTQTLFVTEKLQSQ